MLLSGLSFVYRKHVNTLHSSFWWMRKYQRTFEQQPSQGLIDMRVLTGRLCAQRTITFMWNEQTLAGVRTAHCTSIVAIYCVLKRDRPAAAKRGSHCLLWCQMEIADSWPQFIYALNAFTLINEQMIFTCYHTMPNNGLKKHMLLKLSLINKQSTPDSEFRTSLSCAKVVSIFDFVFWIFWIEQIERNSWPAMDRKTATNNNN